MDTTRHDKAHPNERTYVKVALWLAVVTAAEVAVSYIDMLDWAKLITLIAMAVVKFVVVVGYFMHLKFDNPALRKPLITGLVVAIAVYSIVLVTLVYHSTSPPGA